MDQFVSDIQCESIASTNVPLKIKNASKKVSAKKKKPPKKTTDKKISNRNKQIRKRGEEAKKKTSSFKQKIQKKIKDSKRKSISLDKVKEQTNGKNLLVSKNNKFKPGIQWAKVNLPLNTNTKKGKQKKSPIKDKDNLIPVPPTCSTPQSENSQNQVPQKTLYKQPQYIIKKIISDLIDTVLK